MHRCFISRTEECKGKCKYCFGKWDDYMKFPIPQAVNENTILYPNCDGDALDSHFRDIEELVNRVAGNQIVVSISTKFDIGERDLVKLENMNSCLKKKNNGMLKMSVSFSCRESIPVFEPGTGSYETRIRLMKRIVDKNIPYITIIKPLLPFIDLKEYLELIDDTVGICPYYVIGDLYVNEDSQFYKEYIENKFQVHRRPVSWNGKNGDWIVVENAGMREEVAAYIEKKGGMLFESDKEAIVYLRGSLERGTGSPLHGY